MLELGFGALSPSIAEQLDAQGVALKAGSDVRLFQKDADAITRCLIRGFISSSAAQTARKRLMRNVVAALNPTGEPKQ